MNTMIDSYQNGNLADAKRQAKRYSYRQIIRFCREELGWGTDAAMGIADYLKGHITFDQHCENKANK